MGRKYRNRVVFTPASWVAVFTAVCDVPGLALDWEHLSCWLASPTVLRAPLSVTRVLGRSGLFTVFHCRAVLKLHCDVNNQGHTGRLPATASGCAQGASGEEGHGPGTGVGVGPGCPALLPCVPRNLICFPRVPALPVSAHAADHRLGHCWASDVRVCSGTPGSVLCCGPWESLASGSQKGSNYFTVAQPLPLLVGGGAHRAGQVWPMSRETGDRLEHGSAVFSDQCLVLPGGPQHPQSPSQNSSCSAT